MSDFVTYERLNRLSDKKISLKVMFYSDKVVTRAIWFSPQIPLGAGTLGEAPGGKFDKIKKFC